MDAFWPAFFAGILSASLFWLIAIWFVFYRKPPNRKVKL